MGERWEVRVDHELCDGSAMCVGIAPDHFDLGGDYRSRPRTRFVEQQDPVLSAAECCPNEAIIVTNADTGARVHPVD